MNVSKPSQTLTSTFNGCPPTMMAHPLSVPQRVADTTETSVCCVGGEKSEINVLAGLTSPEACLLGLQMAVLSLPCPHKALSSHTLFPHISPGPDFLF